MAVPSLVSYLAAVSARQHEFIPLEVATKQNKAITNATKYSDNIIFFGENQDDFAADVRGKLLLLFWCLHQLKPLASGLLKGIGAHLVHALTSTLALHAIVEIGRSLELVT